MNRAAALLFSVTLMACTSEPSPITTPSGSPQGHVTASPVSTVIEIDPTPSFGAPPTASTAALPTVPSMTPEPSMATSPTARTSSLADSNRFWDLVTGGEHPDDPRSLRQAVGRSHLIVVGRLSALRFGEAIGGFEVSRATVDIEEVLKGEPESPINGTITLELLPVLNNRDEARHLMPSERHLLFLYYVPLLVESRGDTPLDSERYDYVTVDGPFGPLREFDGIARAVVTTNPDLFPATLDGQRFDRVLEDVRELVAE